MEAVHESHHLREWTPFDAVDAPFGPLGRFPDLNSLPPPKQIDDASAVPDGGLFHQTEPS